MDRRAVTTVCNVIDDDYRELRYRSSIKLGHNPRAVRVAPDGDVFYVYNALDFEVDFPPVSPMDDTVPAEILKNYEVHEWRQLQAECGWQDSGAAMIQLALTAPEQARERWEYLLETDGDRGGYE